MKVITIGRSVENDIVINDAKVSRNHLQIVQNDDGIISAIDLNSSNGTYINGKRITSEVLLQSHDVICIGNTTLPWQNYIKDAPTNKSLKCNIIPAFMKRAYFSITIACVLIISLAIITLLYYCDDNEKQEIMQNKQIIEECSQNEKIEKQLQDEADEVFQQTLIMQNDKNKKLAESKQKEATKAKKESEKAINAQRKAEAARIRAEQDKVNAEEEKKIAEQNSLKKIQETNQKAQQAINKAYSERDIANTKAKLVEIFYEEYVVMKSDYAQLICKELKIDFSKDKKGAKSALKDFFNSSDNHGKQVIINTIHSIKQQNKKVKKVKENNVISSPYKSNEDSTLLNKQ